MGISTLKHIPKLLNKKKKKVDDNSVFLGLYKSKPPAKTYT